MPPVPQPLLHCVSPSLALSLRQDWQYHFHFLFLSSHVTSLPWPAPCRPSLTPAKHCARKSLPPPWLARVVPLYMLHLSLAPCASLSHIVSRLSLAYDRAKQLKTFLFFLNY